MSDRRAVVDLGSNSVSLLVAEGENIVMEEKESVRLAAGMGPEQSIGPEAIDRAVAVVSRLVALSHRLGAGLPLGVATAAVRTARNQEEVLSRLQAATGVAFRVLSGEEEAAYDYLAVVHSLPLTDGLILDVGGGSAELIGVENRQLVATACLPFGAVTISEWLGGRDPVPPAELQVAERRVDAALAAVPWLHRFRGRPLIGLGGTLRNLARVHRRRRKYPLELTHGYEWPPTDLVAMYRELATMTQRSRRKVPGISKARADIVVGGAMIPARLVQRLQFGRILMSGQGLRNGVLLAAQGQEPAMEPLLHGAHLLHARFGNDRNSLQAARVALSLFDQLTLLHDLSGHGRRLLEAAALLSQIGRRVGFYHHARHSAYLLTHAPLLGATHWDIAVVATVVAAQEGGKLDAPIPLDRDARHLARFLAILLRVALGLGAGYNGEGLSVTCRIADRVLVLDARGALPLGLDFLKEDLRWLQKVYRLKGIRLEASGGGG